jgi:putative membrane protein
LKIQKEQDMKNIITKEIIRETMIPIAEVLVVLMIAVLFVFSKGQVEENPVVSGYYDSRSIALERNKEKFADTDMEEDSKFMVAAADIALFECQLAELAQINASSHEVKSLSRKVMDDHILSNIALGALAERKNITIPPVMSENYRSKYDSLSKVKGLAFDKVYVGYMMEDYKKELSRFEKEIETGKDNDIKNWANRELTLLQNHLNIAEHGQPLLSSK